MENIPLPPISCPGARQAGGTGLWRHPVVADGARTARTPRRGERTAKDQKEHPRPNPPTPVQTVHIEAVSPSIFLRELTPHHASPVSYGSSGDSGNGQR